MSDFPEAIGMIITDYLDRVKALLRSIPPQQQEEFLKELRSHIYEAYHESSEADGVAKILGVLRKLGEPAEVVSDRLPDSIVRSGTRQNMPLYVIGGILIAMFGIPLGFGGIAVLFGIMAALVGAVAGYYLAGLGVLLAGASAVLLGMTRMYQPALWDNLVAHGVIQIDSRVAEFLDMVQPSDQGALIAAFGLLLVALAIGMIWFGKYPLRGVRFLFSLGLEWGHKLTQSSLQFARKHSVRSTTHMNGMAMHSVRE